MQPTYPYLPGTVENDWRNTIFGTLAGQAPLNTIGVDGNYFVDIDTSNVWGPKTVSAWPLTAISMFHGLNTIFGATNGSAPSDTVGLDGHFFVDYQTSSVFGPKAGGVWPGSPVASLMGPANVIFGDSGGAVPSNSVGLDGFYFFDVSTSEWYGPKISGAWPPTPVPVAGGVNTIFGNSGGVAPGNAIGIIGSYFYDTASQLYFGPKINTGWPTTGSYLSPINLSNTCSGAIGGVKPANARGSDGQFFVDCDTGMLWGPKAGGAWPYPARYTPPVPTSGGGGGGPATDANTLTGHTNGAKPDDSSVGMDGDWFFDVDAGQVWGPKALGKWPTSPSWIGYHPNKFVSQTNWPIFTRVRGLLVSLSDIHIWDKLNVTKIFGAAGDLSTAPGTTITEDPLGPNLVTTVGFDTDKSFLGPWGAVDTTTCPMAVGQQWQVVDSGFLAGISPETGTAWSLPNGSDVSWGYIPKRTSWLRTSTSGYPLNLVADTHGGLQGNWVIGSDPGGYGYFVAAVGGGGNHLNNGASVDITLMRLT